MKFGRVQYIVSGNWKRHHAERTDKMTLMNVVGGKRGRTVRDEGRSCCRMGCWGKHLDL